MERETREKERGWNQKKKKAADEERERERERKKKTQPRPPLSFLFLSFAHPLALPFFLLPLLPTPPNHTQTPIPQHNNRIDFKIKKVLLDGQSVKLQIWDTAGQERFRTITASYYRGAMGILLVYDVGDRRSFESVRGWMRAVESNAVDGVVRVRKRVFFVCVCLSRKEQGGENNKNKSVVKKRRAVYLSSPHYKNSLFLFFLFFLPVLSFFSLSLVLDFLSSSIERKRARNGDEREKRGREKAVWGREKTKKKRGGGEKRVAFFARRRDRRERK